MATYSTNVSVCLYACVLCCFFCNTAGWESMRRNSVHASSSHFPVLLLRHNPPPCKKLNLWGIIAIKTSSKIRESSMHTRIWFSHKMWCTLYAMQVARARRNSSVLVPYVLRESEKTQHFACNFALQCCVFSSSHCVHKCVFTVNSISGHASIVSVVTT